MPANSGGLWHCLARETGALGHLYSVSYSKPKKRWIHTARGPYPWLPYGVDNGAYGFWKMHNFAPFDFAKYEAEVLPEWWKLVNWTLSQDQKPLWVLCPDAPGNWEATKAAWYKYAPELQRLGFTLALAVQDGATPEDVLSLEIQPDVICVGGTTEWKWETVEMWARSFPRVHVLRCAAPTKYAWLESIGVESTDATRLNSGDKKQTAGVEAFARRNQWIKPKHLIHPFMCRDAPVKGTGQEVLL
jgi:hypothetical protein